MKTNVLSLIIVPLLTCFSLSPTAHAVNPPPDGGYPGGNTAEGTDALLNLAIGVWNTALGAQALNHDTAGHQNTATGYQSLFSNTIGGQNTASGARSLFNNLDGHENTATGYQSLFSNTIGGQNTATGTLSLFSNVNGSGNTADGYQALARNIGHFNTAVGAQALQRSTIGVTNTAIGAGALTHNTTGSENTAIGGIALEDNTIGSGNTAIGQVACDNNRTGGENTAIGHLALYFNTSGSYNTAVGTGALGFDTGSGNIVLGYSAGQNLIDGNDNIYISNPGVLAEDTTIRIGNVVAWTDVFAVPHPAHTATYIAGISGTAVVGDAVVVDGNGQLGTATSAARFKKEIKPMDKASEAILALKPVSFQYKSDSKGTPQFGLIAEEVAKVNPDLVVRDRKGEIYSVRYEAVNAMLLNEFLKARRQIDVQQKQIEALTAGLQKVSAQLEVSKLAPQTVLNSQ
jgi:hypothetical protein